VLEQMRALLEDPHYAKRAAEVGSMVREEDGVEHACDAIEAYLASSAHNSPAV
jgi:rhamnosyltransferase subunit B